MEGLVKGLLDVALGGDHDRNQRDEDGTDERSRSASWAQVVSGDQDHEQNYGGNSNRRNEEGDNGRNERWGSDESRRPQKVANEGYEDGRQGGYNQSHPETEASNDGWETVGKKPPRRHQQVRNDNWDNFKRPASEQQYSNEVEDNSQLEPVRYQAAQRNQHTRTTNTQTRENNNQYTTQEFLRGSAPVGDLRPRAATRLSH